MGRVPAAAAWNPALDYARDMVLVTRLGPLDELSDEFAYVQLCDGRVTNIIEADDDHCALEAIARHSLRGEPLECTFELAGAARRLGYSVSRIPEPSFALVAAYALSLAIQEGLKPQGVELEVFRELGYAAGTLSCSAPWHLWHGEQELRVKVDDWHGVLTMPNGFGTPTVNLAELDASEPFERYQFGVVFRSPVPAFARRWLEQAFSLAHTLTPARLNGIQLAPADTYELVALTAVMRALSDLSPERLRSSATEHCMGATARVEIEAPVPLKAE